LTRGRVGPGIASVVFRVALRLFPGDFRRLHGREMSEDFESELRRRRRDGGVGAAAVYTLRAAWDAARQGSTERIRRGPLPGHGGHETGKGRRDGMLEGTGGDVRLALRSRGGARGFTAAAVVVLALGIGANTTVFSALKMAILAPPPYPEADRLVMVDLTSGRAGKGVAQPSPWSYPKFQRLLAVPDRLVDPVAGYAERSATLTDPGEPALLPIELVSPGYFEVLGAEPLLGRAFVADEGDAMAPRLVAVLSWGTWQDRFAGDPGAVGRTLVLNGERFEVVGVAPRGFAGLSGDVALWIPMASAAELFSSFMIRGAQAHWLHAVGRLVDGATLDQARAQVASIGNGIAEAFPLDDPNVVYGADVRALTAVRVNGQARAAVLLLSVAAALVLLVACANLSGLLLARAKRRARDAAVRLAVGASRWRLIRASLVESAVLASAGGGAGVLVALWGTRAMAAAWPSQFLLSGHDEMRVTDPASLALDPAVLGFALAVTAATTLLVGLAPAVRTSRSDVAARLREAAGATRRGRRVLGMSGRAALVAAQVALALVLLVGTGLVGRSTERLLDVDLGFDPDHLLAFAYTIPRTDAWADDADAFHARFLERIAALPGVRGVSVGTPPLSGHWSITLVQDVRGHEPIPQGEGPAIGVHLVGDDYFEMLGVPLLQGRTLDGRDGTDAHPTLVLSRTAAQRLYPGEDPVGRSLRIGISADGKDPYAEVVGVVGDVRYGPPDQDPIPEAYYALREFGDRSVTVLVRTSDDPLSLMPAVRTELGVLDPELAIFAITTGRDLVARSTGDRRVVLALLALFAMVTVLLAATGTWGTVAYAVADRRRELGVRMALGARGGRVVGMVLGQSAGAALLGLVVGLAGAWAGARLLEAFMYRTSTRDPVAYAGAAATLLAVVLMASWLPGRRATRVDPSEALRAE
jgi:putative ABC transport system permease protein